MIFFFILIKKYLPLLIMRLNKVVRNKLKYFIIINDSFVNNIIYCTVYINH